MKALRIAGVVIALSAVTLLAYVLANALYTTRPVGFQQIQAADAGSTPLAMAVWYPTDGRPLPTTLLGVNLMSVASDGSVAGSALPLVVISHGNGGGPGSHVDLALALAQQGFVVVAPLHTGDSFTDQSAVGSSRWLVDRTRHIHSAIDHMLNVWPARDQIDAGRIGAYGFSAGGFTALTAIGGAPDLQGLASHCSANPEFVCKLLAEARSPLLNPADAPAPGARRLRARRAYQGRRDRGTGPRLRLRAERAGERERARAAMVRRRRPERPNIQQRRARRKGAGRPGRVPRSAGRRPLCLPGALRTVRPSRSVSRRE
jgi:predicted dienelactone hydrolase